MNKDELEKELKTYKTTIKQLLSIVVIIIIIILLFFDYFIQPIKINEQGVSIGNAVSNLFIIFGSTIFIIIFFLSHSIYKYFKIKKIIN